METNPIGFIADLLYMVITFIAFGGILRFFCWAVSIVLVGTVESIDNAIFKSGIFVKAYPSAAFASHIEPWVDHDKFDRVCNITSNILMAFLGLAIIIYLII